MSKIWLISDTHFYHTNIIKYCNRPFNNVNEMNNTIIENWNSLINKNDTVFHLGDFGFSKNGDLKEIGNKLNGSTKYLIKGNHDSESDDFYKECGFNKIFEFPIIYKDFFILSHKPIQLNDIGELKNIFGHIHNNINLNDKNHLSISVETINYYPISFKQIKEYFSSYK